MTVALRTHNLSLSFGKVRAVNDLGLTVRQGEIYGFLGRNGAGKTTTIRMIMGVAKPDTGAIELDDWRGRRIGVRQKRRIGYVSQQQFFYPWMTCRTLGRFVGGFYPTWDRQEFDRLLAWLDLPPDRKVSHLSGGMQVKLALALALAHRPPLLILDEPTSGLDPVARREFLEIIRHQARHDGRTTFFSSHLIDEVERVADRVGIIHKGRLRYEGDIPSLQDRVREVMASASSPVVVAEAVEADDDSPLSTPPVVNHAEAKRELAALAAANGLTVLRDGFEERPSLILDGDQDGWRQAPLTSDRIHRLSLEDIFISLASEVVFDQTTTRGAIAPP